MRSASPPWWPPLPVPRAARQPRRSGAAGDTERARAGERARTFRSAATGGARVSSACGAETCGGVLALRQQATAHSPARSGRLRGVVARVWRGGGRLAEEEVVAHGGGALGVAVAADMRSGGAGAAQAGKGLGAHLVGRGGGEAENRK